MTKGRLQLLGWILIVSDLVWMGSEFLEISGGGFTRESMMINCFAFPGLALGFCGIHAGQAAKAGRVSLIGVTFSVVAFLTFAGGSVVVLSSVISYEQMSEADWLFAGFLMWIVGSALIGLSIFRARVYPRWTGLVLLIAPVITSTAFMALLPPVLMNVANVGAGIAFLFIGAELVRR